MKKFSFIILLLTLVSCSNKTSSYSTNMNNIDISSSSIKQPINNFENITKISYKKITDMYVRNAYSSVPFPALSDEKKEIFYDKINVEYETKTMIIKDVGYKNFGSFLLNNAPLLLIIEYNDENNEKKDKMIFYYKSLFYYPTFHT